MAISLDEIACLMTPASPCCAFIPDEHAKISAFTRIVRQVARDLEEMHLLAHVGSRQTCFVWAATEDDARDAGTLSVYFQLFGRILPAAGAVAMPPGTLKSAA